MKPVEEKPAEEKPVEAVREEKKDSVVIAEVKPDSAMKKPEEPKPPVKKPPGKPFYFKLVNQESGNEVVGEVHVQESSKATQYQAFRGNEISYIKSPTNAEGTYTVLTQVPGYQQTKLTLAYNDATAQKGPEGEAIITIELKKAKSGNYIDFNHVRFVRNSSIMGPESQNELDGLASLMKENKKYKIKIHGHCNGKQNREMIVIGTSKNFFAMDPAHNKKVQGTAKELSEQRALAVKAYLESQGIESNRISIKAEGGRIPLYPENSTLTDYNDRVEVEIK